MSDALFTRRDARPRRPVEVEVGARSAWLRGPGIAAALDLVESPRMWCPREHCLTIPRAYLDDVLAVLDGLHKRTITLTAVDR